MGLLTHGEGDHGVGGPVPRSGQNMKQGLMGFDQMPGLAPRILTADLFRGSGRRKIGFGNLCYFCVN